jgi:hypothetical protein
VILVQPVRIPEFKPEEAYCTATQMGTYSAIILHQSTIYWFDQTMLGAWMLKSTRSESEVIEAVVNVRIHRIVER